MAEGADGRGIRAATMTYLEESAFPTDLPLVDVIARFWTELRKILPANEMHVIDPYALDAGGGDATTYAGNVVALLTPALRVARRVIVVHGKPREGVRELLAQDIALVNADVEIKFRRGSEMHARYIVADRSSALRMEFSFNRIGKSFGTVSVVEGEEDLAGIIEELERLHPTVGE